MADNTTLNAGSGGDVIATDDVVALSAKVPRNKIGYGTDGNYTEVAGTTTGLPVQVGDGAALIEVDTAVADGESNSRRLLHTEAWLMGYNGSTWDRLRSDTTNGLDVDVTRLPALAAGTNNIGDVDVLTVPAPLSTTGTGTSSTALRVTIANDTATPAPHLINFSITSKTVNATSAQTGTAIWTPASGKKIAVTSIQIQSYGTTAGTCQVWFGASADTTYTRGTDLAVFDGEFAPSTTSKPGVVQSFPWPCVSSTVDHVLRYTTTNAQSITITVWGYEF